MDILRRGLEKIGIADCENSFGETTTVQEICEKLEKYINEIILFNSAYNLTNTSDRDELVTRHVLDSLSPYKIIKKIAELGASKSDFCCADIGSGSGFPGIPLAAVFPDLKFDLIERMTKRCAFLENCRAIMKLKNVNVVCGEAEKIPAEKYDLIVFRAFRPLDKKTIEILLKIVKKGGYLCAYKAKMQNIILEMAEIKNFAPEYRVEKLIVPGLEDSERNLVIIQKK